MISVRSATPGPIEKGWLLWPLIPYSYDTPVDRVGAAPLPPNGENLLGTDDTKRDVVARVIYGFRLSILFTLIVTTFASIIGITAGAIQGYFGGRIDLFFQRFIEIWSSLPVDATSRSPAGFSSNPRARPGWCM